MCGTCTDELLIIIWAHAAIASRAFIDAYVERKLRHTVGARSPQPCNHCSYLNFTENEGPVPVLKVG